MESIDVAYQTFEKLLNEIKGYDNSIFSEQDARVKVIDRILIEILGYDYETIFTEPHSGEGFIDYKIEIDGIGKLIIEAKKDGLDFNISDGYCARPFILNGPVFSDRIVKSGLSQTIYYAGHESVELGCLTNGRTWILFRANRLGDGKRVLDGKGIVFSSLECVRKEFKLFYEVLGRENVLRHKYRAIFQEAEGLIIRTKSDCKALRDENNLRIIERGQYSYDFDRVMNEFFSKISGDTDPNFLVDCFVETKESKAADSQLVRISEDLVGKIRAINTEDAVILNDIIERVKNTNRHEFVLLVGGKGAGKSTFVDRFFKLIISQELKESCLLIRINVGESDGDTNKIIDWINSVLLEECERVLFEGVAPTYEQIVGMYFNEYKRLSEGSLRDLYERDKQQFKIDFGKHYEERREKKPHEHIKRLIGDITKSRKKIPCVVFDNTDHFGIEFQEKVFQYARSIYEKEVCLVIVPITDKTSWQLSKQGAIQSFESETLFLPTPPPKKIIEKRIEYIEKVLSQEKGSKGHYFLKRGIKLELTNIEYFVRCLNSIFLKNDVVSKWIGNLANLDIRRCLDLTRDIIASPHLSLDDLMKAFYSTTKEDKPIPLYKIKNSIIKKIYSSYPIGHHSFVQNVYYATNDYNTSPLLSIRILQLLLDKKNVRGKNDDFLTINEVLEYLANMGFARSTILSHLDFLLKKGLIYSYDPTIINVDDAKKVELSPSGHEHYLWGFYDDDYLFLVLEVTPVSDTELFRFLDMSYYDWNKKPQVIFRFLEYLEKEDKLYCSIPNHSAYGAQMQILQRINWRKKRQYSFISN